VIPFFLGTLFSLLIDRDLAPSHVAFTPFALFVGIAMSITAFPVLARIIEERGLSATPVGSTAIACAAVDDVTAWCVLAVVVAIVKANGISGAFYTVALAALFSGVMLFLIKPYLQRFLQLTGNFGKGGAQGNGTTQEPYQGLVPVVICFVLTAALCTEVIGIHALFGAFLAGVIFPPQDEVRQFLRERLESFSASFLLPLFFAFTGLRTQIGAIEGWYNWLLCFGLIAIAVIGKLGGSMLAARWTGTTWHDAFAIGALMNTRGLMELIVLNLGYDLGNSLTIDLRDDGAHGFGDDLYDSTVAVARRISKKQTLGANS
jgi:Kef-type K+ transport system membrane component KefB